MKNTISKRMITFLVIVTFLMPVSSPMLVSAEGDPVTETSITRGSGTYKDPYQIWNVSQLSQIPDKGLDREYIQMADIVMNTNTQWTPIRTFTGVFNGNGFTIRNMTMTTNTSHSYKGLFGVINGAVIKNVTLDNVKIQGDQQIGSIAGHAAGSSQIINCSSSGSVVGSKHTGGIVGYMLPNQALIKDCYFEGSVSGHLAIGGLVGYMGGIGTIEDSYNLAHVNGYAGIGGIVGDASNVTIRTCYNSGKITGNSTSGGIVATANYIAIENCYNEGEVYSPNGDNGGGIVGSSRDSTISFCYSSGNVTARESVGGLVGRMTFTPLTNSAVMGRHVLATSNYAGRVSSSSSGLLANNVAASHVVVKQNGTIKNNDSNLSSRDGLTVDDSLLTNNKNYYVNNLGWDFTNIWMMPTTAGEYPVLRGIEKPVTSITLSESKKSIHIGESFTLTATVKPENTKNKNIIWSSNDPSIVSVSQSGEVTALSNGQAVITAKSESSGLEAKCIVTVSTPVTGVSISSETETIIRGNSITLTASVLPETATNKNVTWKSSDTEIATVESDGTVTGTGVGSAVITVETVDGKFSAACEITVEPEFRKVNIALNKKASSDSVSSSNHPQNAVDGDANTRWTAKSNTANIYLAIDFEEEVTFEEIKIKEHDNRIDNFKLQYFDGIKWVDFHTGTTIGADFHLSFDPITASAVRLFVVSTKGTYGASIFEFEVISNQMVETPEEPNEPEVPVNLALNKTAAASHTSGSNTAKKAVDGDRESRWTATNNSAGAVLEIDFGEATEFNQIKLYEGYNRVGDFRLQYYNGTDWMDCYAGTEIGQEFVADFETVTGTKVRLIVDTLKGLNGAAIYEFEVYKIN